MIPHAGLANSQPPPSEALSPAAPVSGPRPCPPSLSRHPCSSPLEALPGAHSSPNPGDPDLSLAAPWLPLAGPSGKGASPSKTPPSLWISHWDSVGMSGHLCPGGAVTPHEELRGHPALPALPPAFQPGRCLGWSPHLSELCPCGLGAGGWDRPACMAAAGSQANEVV